MPKHASNLSPRVLGRPSSSCRAVHPAHVSRLSARATRPYPPGYEFPLPFGGWRSLLGPSCSRCGLGPSFRRSSGLLARGPDRIGVTTFRPDEMRRGRVPPIRRDLGAPACGGDSRRPMSDRRAGVWFLVRGSSRQPSIATTFRNAASSEVHSRSPLPSFPCPVRLDGSGSPWASPVCSRTSRYRGACAGQEPTSALVGAVVTRQLPLIWCDFVSHRLRRNAGAGMAGNGCRNSPLETGPRARLSSSSDPRGAAPCHHDRPF